MIDNTAEFARKLDNNDNLHKFRSLFIKPEFNNKQAIYFLGNSLGLQPLTAFTYIKEVLEEWSEFGVEGFFKGSHPWIEYHNQLVEPLSSITGALPEEIVVMNQLTVNLHLMLISFYNPKNKRKKILCDHKAFPSDQYMLESHLVQRGLNPEEILIEVKPRKGEYNVRNEDILYTIEEYKDDLSLVLLAGVNYYTGQVLDMQRIASKAKSVGAMVGFDLAHAVGNVELKLHDWDIDFACWCSYKYLNSGPGAIAGNFIHSRYHNDKSINRFSGWWGNKLETRFEMKKHFDMTPTAEGWQLSTPSPLLYACHKAALEIFEEAGMESIIKKGQLLSDYLLLLLDEVYILYNGEPFEIITPMEHNEKGCQISILMKRNGKRVFEYMTEHGVFADWRHPDVIRVAPVPLYNTFEEAWQFTQIFRKAIKYTMNEPS